MAICPFLVSAAADDAPQFNEYGEIIPRSTRPGEPQECKEGECALYNEYLKTCAVNSISSYAYDMDQVVRQLYEMVARFSDENVQMVQQLKALAGRMGNADAPSASPASPELAASIESLVRVTREQQATSAKIEQALREVSAVVANRPEAPAQTPSAHDQLLPVLEQVLEANQRMLSVIEGQQRARDETRQDEASQEATDHAWAGFRNIELGSMEAGVIELRRAAELDPEDAASRNNLGAAYLRNGSYEQAVSVLEEAVALDPDFPEALNNLGLALQKTDSRERARDVLTRAKELNPTSPHVRTNLGNVHYEDGDVEAALKEWEEALRLDPWNLNAYRNFSVLRAQPEDVELPHGVLAQIA